MASGPVDVNLLREAIERLAYGIGEPFPKTEDDLISVCVVAALSHDTSVAGALREEAQEVVDRHGGYLAANDPTMLVYLKDAIAKSLGGAR